MTTTQRLFDARLAFESPVTLGLVVAAAALIALGVALPALLRRTNAMPTALADEITVRSHSWAVIAAAVVIPILLGAAWTIAVFFALTLLCQREFARATGVFRCHRVMAAVAAATALLFLAVADHWFGLFAAVTALGPVLIAAIAVTADRPAGYIQRVALGTFAFLLIGVGLAHLAYFANDADYRPMLLTILAAVALNDVFAFICGKGLSRFVGRTRFVPNTSPNKTLAGALGAAVLTTALVYGVGGAFLPEGYTRYAAHLLGLGVLISVAGQLGDLVLSSIKRDLGVKDLGHAIPGHGGLLDRADSLLLAAPAVFHYVAYFRGVGENQTPFILTGPLLGLP